jgi:hypothetical protein
MRVIDGEKILARIFVSANEVASDLPMVIEVVEDESRLDELTAILDEMMHDGMVTIERARVIKYSAGKRPLDVAKQT